MKITRYKADPKQPYSLHDFRINGMDFIEGDLKLSFENGFMNLDGQEHPDLQGNIVIEQVDPDFCEVVIQGKGGKKGGFRGEKLTITEFTEKYKSYSFEVIDGEKISAKKSEAYKKALKEAGISDKRIDSVMRLAKADGMIDAVEFDGENVKDADKITEGIKKSYGDDIETTATVGASTANPPSNTAGGSKMTRAEIYAKDDKGRYKLSTEERQKAISENISEFTN